MNLSRCLEVKLEVTVRDGWGGGGVGECGGVGDREEGWVGGRLRLGGGAVREGCL